MSRWRGKREWVEMRNSQIAVPLNERKERERAEEKKDWERKPEREMKPGASDGMGGRAQSYVPTTTGNC